MKSIRTGIIVLAGAVLSLAPGRIEAQTYFTAKVTITATIYEQGATNDNSTTTTIKAPTKVSVTTASLLKQLVIDEASEGNLPSTTLPKGAALYFNGSGFEIDQGTNQLADVSDILTYTVSGQNDVTSGSFLDATGAGTAPYSQSDMQLVTIAYDDSSSTGALTFSATGLATITGKATTPNAKSGKYTISGGLSLADGTGEGMNAVGPFVITGLTLTASGSTAADCGCGSAEQGD